MKASHQVEHFQTHPEALKRYEKIVEFFGRGVWMHQAGYHHHVVMDVGCGPYGGIFSTTTMQGGWCVAIGIDPLWKKYASFKCPPTVVKVNGTLEDFHCYTLADAIVCVDALNYAPKPRRFAKEAVKHLRPHGRIYLHVNLRRKRQLNKEHPYHHRIRDIDKAFGGLGLKQLRREILKKDPFSDKAYRTYIGVWEKQ